MKVMHTYKVIGKFDDIESNSKMNIVMHKQLFYKNCYVHFNDGRNNLIVYYSVLIICTV
ncbi:hypothetical protein KTC96_06690 [Clostridium estertheticum]|uniref:hypothetical protein n=1 Tax=Clostridium estertheticum TaxID=238834 RepID=UPI0027155B34|nr:hypothetical protein [Clostridium estertheticum]WLC71683.1 hypothetical protein KTC96_06690 [Clostridium estertheticum]